MSEDGQRDPATPTGDAPTGGTATGGTATGGTATGGTGTSGTATGGTGTGGTATGDFLAQMVRDLGDTVRREVEQLRTEASERAAGGAKAARLLAGAGAAGAVGAIAVGTLPIMALRRVMPGWAIAVAVAAGAGALSAVLTRRGLGELGVAVPGSASRIKDAARDAVRAVV